MDRRLLAVLLVVPMIAGCLSAVDSTEDGGPGDVDDPANVSGAVELPDEITGFEHRTQVDAVESAAGIWPDGDRLYVSGTGSGFYVLDVTEPEEPVLAGKLESGGDEGQIGYNRDVDVLHHDNRTVAVLAQASGGVTFVDVSDPSNMTVLTRGYLGGGLDTDDSNGNAHNIAVVPNASIVYVSRSVDTPGVDVVDASDPTDPERLQVFGDLTCHDVWVDGDMAYCAGVRETQIWDVSAPAEPEVLGRIVNPAIQIHHQAFPSQDGELLFILDEFAGSSSAAYGCYGYEDVADRGASDPVGALWVYDISDPETPVPQGWIAPDAPTDNSVGMAPCTAHFGTTVADRPLLVAGWRTAGTYLVDFSEPTNPRFVDGFNDDAETWETRYHRGVAYTGDTARGLDVIGFVGE